MTRPPLGGFWGFSFACAWLLAVLMGIEVADERRWIAAGGSWLSRYLVFGAVLCATAYFIRTALAMRKR